ncbi:hypothetical protein Tco_1024089 [Tanacetum coccineum]
MLLYSWDGGLDVCVDVTGSSSLTQTRMADFVPGRAVIDVVQRKRVKGGCGYLAEKNPEFLHGLGHWGTSDGANLYGERATGAALETNSI